MGATDYRRFIILFDARTGSHMLAGALDTNSHIVCFREVFNGALGIVQYDVEGYDNEDVGAIAFRKEHPVRFLRERIFSDHPDNINAVGFKFSYHDIWGFAGILEALVADTDLYVLHLQRRNQLRMLVSLKLAQTTGRWRDQLPPRPKRSALGNAIREPVRVVRRLREKWMPPPRPPKPANRISPDELQEFMDRSDATRADFEAEFKQHPMLDLFYEDMVTSPQLVLNEAQSFLGLQPKRLRVDTRQLNPEPLRELIENYDELYDAFKNTHVARFFE